MPPRLPGLVRCFAPAAALLLAVAVPDADTPATPGFAFTNIAARAGLTALTVFGGERTNRYLLETTGTGVALIDYDNDGWLDMFFVNGSTLEGFRAGRRRRPAISIATGRRHLRGRDRAAPASARAAGARAPCAGDYDNDGDDDLFVTYWGQNRLFRNDGNGTFDDVTARAGRRQRAARAGAPGCAFLDYDRDGRLDLFVANYIDLDLATAPTPDVGPVPLQGPRRSRAARRGCPAARTSSTTTAATARSRTSPSAPGITRASGTYGLGVSTLDFDNDGWIDVYVANDSNPSALYRNNHDGTFTDIGVRAGCAYSQDGKPQAGMGVAIGDYDRNGTHGHLQDEFRRRHVDAVRQLGDGLCEDRTFAAGIGLNTRWLGWGAGFVDFDNDGWLDLFLANGHVYPEVEQLKTEAGYEQRKVVYRNLRQRPVRRRQRAPRRAGDDAAGRRAARPSATSTTTATSTS